MISCVNCGAYVSAALAANRVRLRFAYTSFFKCGMNTRMSESE